MDVKTLEEELKRRKKVCVQLLTYADNVTLHAFDRSNRPISPDRRAHSSGVAGPLAARGGGRICRPFRHKIGVIPTKSNRTQPKTQRPRILRIGTCCSCNALFLLHANTYEITI